MIHERSRASFAAWQNDPNLAASREAEQNKYPSRLLTRASYDWRNLAAGEIEMVRVLSPKSSQPVYRKPTFLHLRVKLLA